MARFGLVDCSLGCTDARGWLLLALRDTIGVTDAADTTRLRGRE